MAVPLRFAFPVRALALGTCALLISLAGDSNAQIAIVANNAGTNQVALGEVYVQNFNELPTSGSTAWANNSTVPGWYANLTRGQVSTGNMVATSISNISAVAAGSVGGSATLNSLANTNSADRALGGTPSAYTSGSAGIFSSQSVNVVLRIKNSTGSALTGMRVAYDTVATSTGNKDAVAFAYRVFPAGQGTISSRFIETHKYLNTYNGNFSEAMRTEYGNNVGDVVAWKCVVKEIAPTASSRVNRYEFYLRDLNLNPGEEIWLAWHIAKEDEKNPSTDPITTTAIDNVTLSDFTVSRPGHPIIISHPRNLSVATGLSRNAALSVEAKGAASLSYQWRKDGTNIAGATNATHNLLAVTSAQRGSYDCVVTSSGGSVTSLPAKVNTYARQTITTNSDVSFASYSTGIAELEAANNGTLGDLYYPANLASSTNKVPAIVIIHGGGGNNGDKLDNREIQAAQELAARGWFVIAINYAMSSSTQQCWPYNLWDAKQAVRWLKQKGDAGTYKIDKNKIGVCGFSWGCNMGSMLAMTGPEDDIGVTASDLKVEPPPRSGSNAAYDAYSTAVQCSAVFYGACDLPNYHQMNQFLDYTAWNNRTLYRRASPVRYPNKNAAPMLFVHGTADDDVWPNQTEAPYMMQRSEGARLERYLYTPGGEHSYYLYETSRINANFPSPIDQRPETIGFFEKYLVEATERPAIIAEPVSRVVAAGSPATFSVEATGTPAPSYQWRKNGTNIGGATGATYTVGTASADTAGYYDVVVSNSAGAVSSAAALLTAVGNVVETPVSIDSPPSNQTVSVGQTASFSVGASGTEPITYQWRKSSNNIAGATNDTLAIVGVTTNDAGSYDVVCRNVTGGLTNTATSTAAILTVIPSQAAALVDSPELANQFSFASGYSQTFSNMPGTNVTISNWVQESTLPGWSAYKQQFATNSGVVTTNYVPPPEVRGASNGVIPSTGNFYSISNSLGYAPSTSSGPGFLVLRVANQSVSNLTGMSLVWDLINAGRYTTNGGNWSNVVSVSYMVTPANTTLDPSSAASYPPSFANTNATMVNGWKLIAALTNKTVPVAADLSNAISGLEVAPGTEIRIGWNVVKGGGSNTISAIDNVRLVSLTSGAIGLDKAPEIVAAPANQFVAAGTAVQLKATVTGRPTPLLQWYKNGTNNPLTDQTTPAYGIPEADPSDAGTYILVASNGLGITNTSATLTVADTTRTNAGVFSNNQSVAFDFSTISNSFSYWFNYGLVPGVAAFSITNTNATPFAFTNYATWPGTFNTGTLVLASTTNGLALGGVGSSTKSQMLVFRMANRSAGLIKGFRVNFTPLALTNASAGTNPPNLQGTLAASYKVIDAANASDTDPANYPPNFASTNAVSTNGWVPMTNIISSNVIVPVAVSQAVSGVNIQPDQEIWLGFYLAKPNGDTHFLGVKDVSVDQFTVQSLDKPLPVITFTNPGTLTYGQSVALSATSTGGNAATYSVVSGGGTITNNILTATSGTGSVVVRASFAETAEYSANEANVTVSLAKAAQTISFTLDPATAAVGDAPRTLTATATSGLPVSFASSSPSVASVSGSTLTFATGGTTTITASQAGDANYSAATPVDRTLTVTAPPEFVFAPGDLAIVACNDSTDAFGVLVLVDIPIGAVFRVTDYGWQASGGFYSGATEGVVSYTATAPVAKGTVLKWTSGAGAPWSQTGSFNFATAGDQLIVYQGTAPATGVPVADRLIYALQSRNGWANDATSSGTSAEPTSAHSGNLVSGVTAVTVPGNESGYYTGPLSGTREFLLGKIADVTNWTAGAGDFANTLWASAFTINSKATPTVGFGATPTSVVYGQSITLSATSTGDGSPTYSIVSGSGASLAGDQLSATSGTGSLTVRASFAETASFLAGQAELNVALAKANGVVSLDNLTQSAGAVTPVTTTTTPPGLSCNVTYGGSSTLPTSAGSYAVLASISDLNYLGSASGTLVISPTFQNEFGGASATSDTDGDGISALVEYGLGGSLATQDGVKVPAPVWDGSFLSLTVEERINDPKLAVSAEGSTEPGFTSFTSPPSRSVLANQAGVTTGFQRVRYSLSPAGSSKLFMRIKFTLNP